MNIEGHIAIKIHADSKQHQQVSVQSTRPVHAAKIFIGKTPEQVLSLVPLLFNVCGVAQSRASLFALTQALGLEQNQAAESARDLIVLSETAKEHCLRIFMDWPQLFDIKINTQALSYLSQLIPSFKSALFKQGDAFSLSSQCQMQSDAIEDLIDALEHYLVENIFHCSLQDWLNINSIDALHNWSKQNQQAGAAAYSLQHIFAQSWASQGKSACQPLPNLNSSQLVSTLNSQAAKQFIEQPTWQGEQYETNSLSRHIHQPLIQRLYSEYDCGLITRWTARLVELALIPQHMRDLLKSMQNKPTKFATGAQPLGIAQIEAARGRLIHRVELAQDKNRQTTISNYQIIAPTEWNFHPDGLIHHSLMNIKARNQQEHEQLARLMINAIDPCVEYQLSIH